jgi:hypothetical protein
VCRTFLWAIQARLRPARLSAGGGRRWAGGAQGGLTPLRWACKNGHGEVAKVLLADGRVDVNQALTVRVVGGARAGGDSGQAGRWVRCRAQYACHGGGRQELPSAGRRV